MLKQGHRILVNQRLQQAMHLVAVDGPQHVLDVEFSHLIPAIRDRLVRQAEGVTHAAVCCSPKKPQCRFIEGNRLSTKHSSKMTHSLFRCHVFQVELQATRQNGHRELFGLRCGQQEFNVWWRLLEGHQQGVETVLRQHVYLVDEIHLEATAVRHILHVVHHLARVFNFGLGCTVNLDQVNGTPLGNLDARCAFTAGFSCHAKVAIEALGEDSGDRCFPHAAGAGKQVSMV